MQETPHHGDRWFKEAAEQGDRRKHLESMVRAITGQAADAGTPLGETGDFPQGSMTPDDEGAIRMAVSAQHGKVVIAFGKPIAWLGMSPREARQLADALNKWAVEV